MAQLVFAASFLRASRGQVGPTAWYGRQRIIARMQEGVDSVDIFSLARAKLDSAFQVRLLSNERRQRGRYA